MEPTPTAPVPIYVGGLSEIAFARAARHDGWVGDMYKTDEAIGWATRLAEVAATRPAPPATSRSSSRSPTPSCPSTSPGPRRAASPTA